MLRISKEPAERLVDEADRVRRRQDQQPPERGRRRRSSGEEHPDLVLAEPDRLPLVDRLERRKPRPTREHLGRADEAWGLKLHDGVIAVGGLGREAASAGEEQDDVVGLVPLRPETSPRRVPGDHAPRTDRRRVGPDVDVVRLAPQCGNILEARRSRGSSGAKASRRDRR